MDAPTTTVDSEVAVGGGEADNRMTHVPIYVDTYAYG